MGTNCAGSRLGNQECEVLGAGGCGLGIFKEKQGI